MSPADLTDAPSVAVWLADRLEEDGIAYAVGGALARGAHGAPRMTRDVVLATYVPEPEVGRLFDALERAGCLFRRDDARRDVERRALFRVRLGRVDVDVFVAFHTPGRAARRVPRARKGPAAGAPPERPRGAGPQARPRPGQGT